MKQELKTLADAVGKSTWKTHKSIITHTLHHAASKGIK
jgi:hypothetical protein